MKSKAALFINYLNLASALLLTFLSIYKLDYQRLTLYIFFISYFIEIFTDKKWHNIKFKNNQIYYLTIGAFFLLGLAYLPFESDKEYFSHHLNKRLPLLGIAVIGFLGVNDKYRLSYFLKTLVASSVIALTYLFVIKLNIIDLLQDVKWQDTIAFTRRKYINEHMMFNFYLNITLVGIWYLTSKGYKEFKTSSKIFYLSVSLLIICTLMMSEGRSGILAFIITSLLLVFLQIWRKAAKLAITAVLLIVVAGSITISKHPRFSVDYIEHEPRVFLWQSAINVISNQSILGNGISTAQSKFDKSRANYQTEEYRLTWQNHKYLDSHNQYLQTTMEFGILGLLLLLTIYTCPILTIDSERKLLASLWLFLIIFQSIFDMFITGQFSMFFGIIILCLLSIKNDVTQKNQIQL